MPIQFPSPYPATIATQRAPCLDHIDLPEKGTEHSCPERTRKRYAIATSTFGITAIAAAILSTTPWIPFALAALALLCFILFCRVDSFDPSNRLDVMRIRGYLSNVTLFEIKKAGCTPAQWKEWLHTLCKNRIIDTNIEKEFGHHYTLFYQADESSLAQAANKAFHLFRNTTRIECVGLQTRLIPECTEGKSY